MDPCGVWNSRVLYFFGALAGHGVPGRGGALRGAGLPGAQARVFHAQEAAGRPGAGAVGAPRPGAVRRQVGLVEGLGVGRVGRRREVVPRGSAMGEAGEEEKEKREEAPGHG